MRFQCYFKEVGKYKLCTVMLLKTPNEIRYLIICDQNSAKGSTIIAYKVAGGYMSIVDDVDYSNKRKKIAQGLLCVDSGGQTKYFKSTNINKPSNYKIVDTIDEIYHTDFSNFTSIPELNLSYLKKIFPTIKLRKVSYKSMSYETFNGLNDWISFDVITNLYLSNIKLSSLPKALRYFKNLHTIIAKNNEIVEIDKEVFSRGSRLNTCLKHLNLSNNQIKQLPSSFFNLKNIETLDLASNAIEYIQHEIEHLKKLEYLYLDDNQLKCLPASITKLQTLNQFDMARNPLYQFGDGLKVHIQSQKEDIIKLYHMCFNFALRNNWLCEMLPDNLDVFIRFDERKTCFCGDKIFTQSRKALVEIESSKISFRSSDTPERVPLEVISCSKLCFSRVIRKLTT